MTAATPSPLSRYPGVGFLTHGDLALVTWTGEPSLAANRWLVDRMPAQVMSRHPSWLLLQIISPSCGTPGPEARQYVQEAFKTRLATVRCMVTVPLGDSLKQSIVRTIMRGMVILSGRSQTITVASSVDDALRLLGSVSSPDTPGRREVLADLRASFAELGVTEPLPPL